MCITPLAVTPDSQAMQTAEKFYAELTARGVDVILDDRDERPGVKFKDADLVGFPIRIALGEKSLAKGPQAISSARICACAAVPYVTVRRFTEGRMLCTLGSSRQRIATP